MGNIAQVTLMMLLIVFALPSTNSMKTMRQPIRHTNTWRMNKGIDLNRKSTRVLRMMDETTLSLLAGAVSGSIGVGVAYPLGESFYPYL